MKKWIFTTFLCLFGISCWAQKDSTDFNCKIYNKEYDVYMVVNFYDNNVKVPGQEIFGEMPGYFGDYKDSRKWLITDAKVKDKKALLSITNDYGSEDLTAELSIGKDGVYTLKQLSGSTLKIARNRKWVKMPKNLEFVRK